MKKEIIPTIALISATISYHYGKEIERYYTYFLTLEIISKMASEIFLINEHKIPGLIPIEFNLMVLQEAKRLLKINNSIQIPDELTTTHKR